MSVLNLFVGVPQSKLASMAILIALVVVAIAIIFGKETVPLKHKFIFMLILGVVTLPSILLSLFHLTCLVTGSGAQQQRWWCTAYAWICSLFIVFYCALIVVLGVATIVNGNVLKLEPLSVKDVHEEVKAQANMQAKEFFSSMDKEELPSPINEDASPPENIVSKNISDMISPVTSQISSLYGGNVEAFSSCVREYSPI